MTLLSFLIADPVTPCLQMPLPWFYCEDEEIAKLLLAVHAIPSKQRKESMGMLLAHFDSK